MNEADGIWFISNTSLLKSWQDITITMVKHGFA